MKNLLAQRLHLPGIERGISIEGPLSESVFPQFKVASVVDRAMSYIFLFAGVGLLLMLLSGGFSFMTSAGDPKKMETAKQRLTWSLAGFLIIFMAYWIVQILQIMVGFDLGF